MLFFARQRIEIMEAFLLPTGLGCKWKSRVSDSERMPLGLDPNSVGGRWVERRIWIENGSLGQHPREVRIVKVEVDILDQRF